MSVQIGEIRNHPNFSNFSAKTIRAMFNCKVSYAICTRHQKALLLDLILWILVFRIDKSSLERES